MPYPFNYGAFPQSFEDPTIVDQDTQAKGLKKKMKERKKERKRRKKGRKE